MGMRNKKISVQVQRILLDIFHQGQAGDKCKNFIVTEVEVNRSLSHAKVFLSAESCEKTDVLEQNCGFLRTLLARRLQLKYAPQLSFQIDRSVQNYSRISQLLTEARSRIR